MKNTMKSVKQDSFSHTYLLYFIPGKSTSTTTEYLKQKYTATKRGNIAATARRIKKQGNICTATN